LLVAGVALLSTPSKPKLGVPAPAPLPIDWSSSLTWSRVPHDAAVFGGNGGQGLVSVTVGGPGLVAVGWDEGDAMVLTSVDGVTWSRVPHDEEVFGGAEDGHYTSMDSVTAGGPGLVAVGWDPMGAAAWTSVDGITWSRVPHDAAVFGAQPKPLLEMRSIIAGGPGLVAVGANTVNGTSEAPAT